MSNIYLLIKIILFLKYNLMKYESKYTSLEQYQTNPPNRNNKKKFQKKNLTSNEKSLNAKNSSNQKIEVNSSHSINYPTTNQPKNSKKSDHILIYGQNRTNNSINKDIHHRDYFLLQPYRQDDSTSYEDSISRTNINIRLIELHSQSIDNSQNSTNRLANKTSEDNRYRSNYSYYESKYTSRKRSEQDDNQHNKIATNIKNNDNLKVYSNENSIKNIPLTRKHLIQENNNVVRNQKSSSSSKSKMIDSTYYQIQKGKNNNLIISSSNKDKKGPIIFKNSYNSTKNSVNPYIPINNSNIKTTIQPSTPIGFSHSKISPEKLNEKIKSIHIHELIQNNSNKTEKNIPSKSLEKVRIKKLIYNQHNQTKNKNTAKYKKKIDITEEKKIPNLIKPFELDLEKSSLSARETNLNSQNKIRNKVLNINKNSENNKNIIIISGKDINDSNVNKKNNNLNLNKNYNNILNNKNKDRNNKNNDNKNNLNDSNKKSSKVNDINEKNKTIFNMIKNNVQINSTKSSIITNNKNSTLNNSGKENLTKKIVNLKENNNNTNTTRSINFNIALKPLLQEHLKTQANEVKSKVRDERNLSNEKQKKKHMIQGIKILDSNGIKNLDVVENKKYNKILPKNKIIEISKKNTSNNKDNKDNKENKENKENKNNNKLIIEKYYKENKNIKNSNSNNNNKDSKSSIKSINKDYNISENFKKVRSEQISELKINKIKNDIQTKKYSKEKYEEKKTLNNNIGKNNNNMNNITSLKIGEYNNGKNSGDVVLENKIKSINNNLKNNISNFKKQTSHNIKSNVSNLINSNNENKRNSINKVTIKTLSPENKQIKNIKLNSSSKVVEPSPLENKSTQKTNNNQSESLKNRNIHNRIICSPKKANKKKEKEDEWDKMQYMGMTKRTYDPSLRQAKKGRLMKNEQKTNSLKAEFSSTIYVKSSEGLSIPGKSENGLRKTNQDTLLIERNVNGVLNFNIFGVLDGHGEDGHFVSKFVSRFIFNKLKSHPLIKKLDEPKQIYYKLKENGYEIIANIFLDADVQIQKEKFDFHRSGTTCVMVIELEEHIICANTGDSRAIAVFDENYDDNLMGSKVYPLSYDCKPELPNELMRIIEYGGVVDKAYDIENPEIGPFRVWAKGKDYPGLAMSRSIGDMDAKKVGVIPNPQIVEYTIDYYSKYLILASDGIWEFISSEQAMKYCNKFYMRNDAKGLCQDLTQKASALWEKNDCCIDDITVLVVFF